MKKIIRTDLHTRQLVIVSTGYSATIEPHAHDYFELVYVLGGRAEHVINGNHYIIGGGDYFLIDINQEHEYRQITDKEMPIINVLFSPRLIDSGARPTDTYPSVIRHRLINFEPSQLGRVPTEIVFHDSDDQVRQRFIRMLDAYKSERHGYREQIRAELLTVLIPMLQSVALPQSKYQQKDFVRYLADYAEENYAKPVSLTELCRDINYSLPYVSKCFRAGTGMTFSEYLQRIRITRCCALLCETPLPVEEICRMVGYSNTAFFHRIFRHIVGLTPRDYRKLNNPRQP